MGQQLDACSHQKNTDEYLGFLVLRRPKRTDLAAARITRGPVEGATNVTFDGRFESF